MSGNERRAPKRWTGQEDKILWEETQKQSRTGNVKDWNRIAAKLPNRTNKDCRKRWVNTLSGCLKKGAWDDDEDERLIQAVNSHGQKWTLVANEVGFRSPDQCAKRWQHNLDPKLEHKGWTEAEDELLLASVEAHGREWKLIQERSYNTRSRNDLKNRYSILSRRRDSKHVRNTRRHGGSPSTPGSSSVSTPGKGLGEDQDFGAVPRDTEMKNLSIGGYGHDPAYSWEVRGAVDDSWFNPANPGPDPSLDTTNSDSVLTVFSPPEGTIPIKTEDTDPLYNLTTNPASDFSWIDFGVSGEGLYGDPSLGPHTPPKTEFDLSESLQNQDLAVQMNDTIVGDSMRRRVSLVVDECDWSTLSYLLNVAKPLNGKVKVEMAS